VNKYQEFITNAFINLTYVYSPNTTAFLLRSHYFVYALPLFSLYFIGKSTVLRSTSCLGKRLCLIIVALTGKAAAILKGLLGSGCEDGCCLLK
jgi:hypothetical protein